MEPFRGLGLGESKDSKEEWIESVRNQVLSSPELLWGILEKLDLPRQKECRLTSTLWNQVICSLFQRERSKAQVRIFGEEDCVEFRALMESHYDHKDSSDPLHPYPFLFIALLYHGDMSLEDTNWLCSNFKIVELSVSSTIFVFGNAAKHAMSVLRGSASTLRSLSIPYLGNWEDEDEETQSSSDLHFPQLEVLIPTATRYSGFGVWAPVDQQTMDFFTRIISASPRLKSLTLFKYWPDFLEQSAFSTVQRLDLGCSNWDLLGREKFRNLKELKWKLSTSSTEPPQVSHVLSKYSGTLQRLYLTWDDGSRDGQHPTNFPFCPALTQLEVDVLHLDSVNWENLPNLRILRFKRINRDFDLSSSSNNFKTCPSVRKVAYRGRNDVLGFQKAGEFFPKLFQRFPNATDWKVNHKDVIEFCKTAAKASEELHVRKLSVYLTYRTECYGDEDLICLIDRYTFSLLPNLQEMEELVLNNGGEGNGSQMRLSQIDFSMLPKLRRLKVYNYSDPAQKECEALKGIHQVCMVGASGDFGLKEKQPGKSILSAPNVVFRKVPYKCR